MTNLTDEIRQEQLKRVRRRLEALDKIEARLQEMRSLASYAASRNLSESEAVQVQEWVDILQAEVQAIDQETSDGNPLLSASSTCLLQNEKSIQ